MNASAGKAIIVVLVSIGGEDLPWLSIGGTGRADR
jgi:hypothetical protein